MIQLSCPVKVGEIPGKGRLREEKQCFRIKSYPSGKEYIPDNMESLESTIDDSSKTKTLRQ